jgi:hypothetical protein
MLLKEVSADIGFSPAYFRRLKGADVTISPFKKYRSIKNKLKI